MRSLRYKYGIVPIPLSVWTYHIRISSVHHVLCQFVTDNGNPLEIQYSLEMRVAGTPTQVDFTPTIFSTDFSALPDIVLGWMER